MNELKMYFLDVIKNKYAQFNGRARRAEYWYFFLFNLLAGVITSFIWEPLNWIYSLAVLVPGLAVFIRRLHDIGKSGWCMLLFFIPIVNLILIFAWLCKEGDCNANEYGENPKA